MAESFQNEVPKSRINIKLDLHTGGAQKKVELPLKLLVMGDYSNTQDNRALADRTKVAIDKNNFDAVLADYNPRARIAAENTLAGDGSELAVDLDFKCMDDFKPDVVAGRVPELRALMAARNLLRDLKSNLPPRTGKDPQGPGPVRAPARRPGKDRRHRAGHADFPHSIKQPTSRSKHHGKKPNPT
jgi:type VI secretion system protein ImpB